MNLTSKHTNDASLDLTLHATACIPMLPAQDQSELVQHEYDHLRGVLATDIAVDNTSIVSRAVFDKHPKFRQLVDYSIEATL